MNQRKLSARLPEIVAALGVAGMALRWILYRVNLDQRRLLKPGHPLEILLWLLTFAAFVLIVVCSLKSREPVSYQDNFPPSKRAWIGCCVAAFLICYTVLSKEARLPGMPGILWKVLGVLCAPCLLAAGFSRYLGHKTPSLLYLAPCLFYMFHIINHYRVWSSESQLQTYFYPLFAAIAMTFFLFYTAAFAVDMPYRRQQLLTGLCGAFLCLVDLSRTEYPWLCLAGTLLCLTGLCARPKAPETAEGGNDHASA